MFANPIKALPAEQHLWTAIIKPDHDFCLWKALQDGILHSELLVNSCFLWLIAETNLVQVSVEDAERDLHGFG
jgi:hypothetical protein